MESASGHQRGNEKSDRKSGFHFRGLQVKQCPKGTASCSYDEGKIQRIGESTDN